MAAPESLSRDTMDSEVVVCGKCLEMFSAMAEGVESGGGRSCECFDVEQENEFGETAGLVKDDVKYLRGEDGFLYRFLGGSEIRIVFPASIQFYVL